MADDSTLTGPDRETDRAVSDMLAFTLTFAIIITSVGVVSLAGFGTLEDVQDSAQANSAEVSMEGFSNALEDIRADGVPERQLQVRLNGDGFSLQPSVLTVTVDQGPGTVQENVSINALERSTDEKTQIVYASGAIYRNQQFGQYIISRPTVRCGEDTAHVSLIAITGDMNISSGDRLTIDARRVESRMIHPDVSTSGDRTIDSITINASGTHQPEIWNRQFTEQLSDWDQTGEDAYTCDDIDRAFVRVTTIELRAV